MRVFVQCVAVYRLHAVMFNALSLTHYLLSPANTHVILHNRKASAALKEANAKTTVNSNSGAATDDGNGAVIAVVVVILVIVLLGAGIGAILYLKAKQTGQTKGGAAIHQNPAYETGPGGGGGQRGPSLGSNLSGRNPMADLHPAPQEDPEFVRRASHC